MMVTQETAQRIWNCYREIAASEELLKDMEEAQVKDIFDRDKNSPKLKDSFGQRRHLELGVPCGSDSRRIFRVAPQLARSVIVSHIATQRAELAEANEQARIELSHD
jgi:hypothetical protein